MTKKTALKFKGRLDNGEWPPLPAKLAAVLQMKSKEILKSIGHAHRFGDGNGYIQTRRLIQMGLFDTNLNLTNYGDGYLSEIKSKQELASQTQLARSQLEAKKLFPKIYDESINNHYE
jgi:hypothetical protein